MKILLVDDSVMTRKSLKKILEDSGYDFTFEEAANGVDAVQLYKRISPDLVFMDNQMPEMDGLTALEKIKEIDSQAKIIMCSSEGYKDKVIEAAKAGAVHFIAKPYESQGVINNVKKVLNL